MTGYVCLLDRSGTDADPRLLKRLAEPLEAYGGTLADWYYGPIGLAILSSRRETVVAGNSGPATDLDTGASAVLSGRIHTARDGSVAGACGPGKGSPITPAQALAAFLAGGADFLADVTGAFVAIFTDPRHTSLTIARDHLGEQKLYYYLDQRWLIAASEPSAILRHCAVSRDPDEGSAARFLGFRFSHTTASFFRQIKELPPAHWLRVTPRDCETRQYWRFAVRRGMRRASREQVRTEFLSQLKQSVANHVEGLEPEQIAVSLSGGLDSTSVAALAPHGVRLHSWYLDDTPDDEERHNINLFAEHLQKPVHWSRGDGLYPLSGDYVEYFVHENSPHLNAFALLKRRLYRAASEAGCERVLIGDGGDVLYAAQDYWLRDLLLQRDPSSLKSLVTTIRAASSGDKFALLTLRRLLPVRHLRAAVGRTRLPWLTEAAHAALPHDAFSPVLPPGGSRYRFDPGVGTKYIEAVSEGQRLFAQCGIERGNPFWHWPLLETVLSLPAWWFYRDGRSKVLTREAMKGLLPDVVRESPRVGLLGAFFLRGMELEQARIRDMLFGHPRSDWQHYVDRTWLEKYLGSTDSISFGHTILWRVISYELWYRRLIQ